MRTTRKLEMLELQLIGKENRKKGNDNSRAVRSVVQRPTRAHRIIIFGILVFVSQLFLLCVLSVIVSCALFSSRVILAPRELPTKILLWLLCWASVYNDLENIFHVCEHSELKWNSISIKMKKSECLLTVQRTKIKVWSASSHPVGCLASPNIGDFARKTQYKNFEMHN